MDLTVVAAAGLVCLLGGVLPWINAEVAVLGAAAVLPDQSIPLLVIACAGMQMTAKAGLYGITRWAPHRLPEGVSRLLGRADRYRRRPGLLAVAAFSGAAAAVPPFYLVTLACGVLRVPFALYALAGLAGTVARYGVLVWAASALGF